MARELGSPKAIDRMTAYIHQARPRTEEMLVDEMLAIKGEIDAWRAKKEAEEAQASYNARLYYKNGNPKRRNKAMKKFMGYHSPIRSTHIKSESTAVNRTPRMICFTYPCQLSVVYLIQCFAPAT